MCAGRFRTFNFIDDFSREALTIEIDLNLPAQRVVRAFERRGYGQRSRVYLNQHEIQLEFIQPNKPTSNSFVERLNLAYRDEILNMYVFRTLKDVCELTENKVREYNDERPHSSPYDLTPWEYLAK
ncbi:hypothetical protein TUMSATVNIG3_57530 (plasmid) [Vibrio nigripulchritudo]|nr:hypothetical protein TUMSATVNIG2_56590 [Vibrio nigripulchritudo]BDU46955.1 hypothetical protein TUMSATVNIG3_57530 [Vibrio nigripulchritudo]